MERNAIFFLQTAVFPVWFLPFLLSGGGCVRLKPGKTRFKNPDFRIVAGISAK
jgi:hypothetical protein